MKIRWSPHANSLFLDVLLQIEQALYIDDAYRWRERILKEVGQLADFPFLGPEIPIECFESLPENVDRLRQIVCNPYRIVYEIVDSEIHVLSIRHTRMLIADGDTRWN